jgi:hypothetical protein
MGRYLYNWPTWTTARQKAGLSSNYRRFLKTPRGHYRGRDFFFHGMGQSKNDSGQSIAQHGVGSLYMEHDAVQIPTRIV